jgi:hypothetical protein
MTSEGHITLNKEAMKQWEQRIKEVKRRQVERVTEEEHTQGLYIIRDKVRRMIYTAQVTDSDDHWGFSFYEVYLDSNLWDELKELVE